MRHVGVTILALAVLACEDEPKSTSVEPQPEAVMKRPSEREVGLEQPPADWPPTIPGLLLVNFAVEREGSFARPEGADELTPRAAVALADGLALVGDARAGARRPWIGLAPTEGSTGALELELEEGSITAAISDGEGGALLAGSSGSDARAWFGALDARAKLTASVELDGDGPVELADVLAGHEPDERALLLGQVGSRGWALSLDERGQIRWTAEPGRLDSTLIHAGVRVPTALGELLVVGTQADGREAAWARFDATRQLGQGALEIEGAGPIRTLDAIVALDHDMGLIALGRANYMAEQDHDQVIAVGFDRTGQPTWTRLLDHFRAIEIYGGAVHPKLLGEGLFLVRIPVGGEPDTALGWLEICPGVDGLMDARQIAGTLGWESAGFVHGRDDAAMLTYSRTEAGIDWRILQFSVDHP